MIIHARTSKHLDTRSDAQRKNVEGIRVFVANAFMRRFGRLLLLFNDFGTLSFIVEKFNGFISVALGY